jgi:hypothetical protein
LGGTKLRPFILAVKVNAPGSRNLARKKYIPEAQISSNYTTVKNHFDDKKNTKIAGKSRRDWGPLNTLSIPELIEYYGVDMYMDIREK